ncbi:hypothetical protein EZV73_25690 [Acidaminobacter sp. JC074]|uniref:hypothetical protein n=1 Tax=Acidaminobacter sp. JC074 TaxID=2530199 RepID=UPI001F1160D6|nr:hypothetical protein [Acidaminobacter sp. JC074]MCH4890996.1 hypothetical protein [Acidaminobacter sp. JC074]
MRLNKIMVLILVMLLATVNTVYAGNEVEVAIPEFEIEIGEQAIDNVHNEFPLILYNDITYFPMTWNFSRSLGLSSDWNSQTGLSIAQTSETEKLVQDKSVTNDLSRTYRATIADFDIKLNGNAINNSTEDYPILLFRDVTYFPLTWKFTVDEFGWDSNFDQEKGLRISNNRIQTTVHIDNSDNNTTSVSGVNNSSVVVTNNNIDNSVNDSNNTYNDYSTHITNNIDNSVNLETEAKLDELLEQIQQLNDSSLNKGNILISYFLKDSETGAPVANAQVYLNNMPVAVSNDTGLVEIDVYQYAQYMIQIKHDDYYSVTFNQAFNDSKIINQSLQNKLTSNIIKLGVDNIVLREVETEIIDGRKVDKIDYKFESDDKVLGLWESVDFVDQPTDFIAGLKSFPGDLYLKNLEFYKNGSTNHAWSWTKGLALHDDDNTASRYFIAEVDGEVFLFFEWKSGDYTIRGDEPNYYVLKRVVSND